MNYIAAVDIGGTNIRAAIIDENFKIIEVIKEKTPHNDLAMLLDNVKILLEKLDIISKKVLAISIGVAGRVRKENHIDELPNIGVKDIDFVSYLNGIYHLPIYVRNDAEMAVLAEATVGASKGYQRVYFVTLSTGLGGALAIDGKIANYSKEIGHTPFMYKGKLRDLETLVAGSGIANLARLNGLNINTANEFFKMVSLKDEKALLMYRDWLDLICDFFIYVNNTFKPDIFYVTGGLMNSKDVFFDQLKTRLKNIRIEEGLYKDDVTLIGAAIYAFQSI